jgi:hypothetical protein
MTKEGVDRDTMGNHLMPLYIFLGSQNRKVRGDLAHVSKQGLGCVGRSGGKDKVPLEGGPRDRGNGGWGEAKGGVKGVSHGEGVKLEGWVRQGDDQSSGSEGWDRRGGGRGVGLAGIGSKGGALDATWAQEGEDGWGGGIC